MIVDLPPSIIQLERPAIIRPFAAVCPFLPYLPRRKVLTETLYDRTTGTNIGDMTATGGLAASFDGNTSQSNAQCSVRSNLSNGFVGKTMGASAPISKIVVRSTNNIGFTNTGNVTIQLYAKTSAPSSGTDGTLLGTNAIGSGGSNSTDYTVTSSDTTTSYSNVWAYITSSGGSADIYCAELSIYVMA